MSDRILWGMLVGLGAGLASILVTFILVLLSPRRYCPDCGTPMSKLRNHWDKSDVVRRCIKCGCGMDVKGRKVHDEAEFEPVEPRDRRRSRDDDDDDRPRRRDDNRLRRRGRSEAPTFGTGWIIAAVCGGLLLLGLFVLCIVMIAVGSRNEVARVNDRPAPQDFEPPMPAPEDLGPKQARTEIMGGAADPTFKDQAPPGGLLIGFDIGLGKFFDIDLVKSIRPKYRTAQGEVAGRNFGTDFTKVVSVKAKPGYAVGAINVKTGLLVNGLSVTFMRVKGAKLDPADAYMSQWIGDKTGGNGPITLGGDGTPIIGIIGKRNARDCNGLGLLKKL